MGLFTIAVSSSLRATLDEVWKHASSMEGVNFELGPWVRMTSPREAADKSLADIEPGREAFASVLLLCSVLPFDVHHLTLERVHAHGFDEESWSWLQRRWRHERRVEPDGAGCTVTDRVTVEPRLGPAFLVRPIVQRIFEQRHRRLRARFGGVALGPSPLPRPTVTTARDE